MKIKKEGETYVRDDRRNDKQTTECIPFALLHPVHGGAAPAARTYSQPTAVVMMDGDDENKPGRQFVVIGRSTSNCSNTWTFLFFAR